jgi:di- and tripeptidase
VGKALCGFVGKSQQALWQLQTLRKMASIFASRGAGAAHQHTLHVPLADRSAVETSDDEPPFATTDRASNDAETVPLKEGPELAHRLQNDSSILTLAVGDRYIYAGTQDGEIVVWSLASFELVLRIQGHTRAVLSLFLSPDGNLLFSSAGDAIVNAWCPINLQRLFHIYSTYDVGDVFSVAYSAQFETVYLGAQNTSIQWCSLKDSATRPTPNPDRHPDRRNHRFFDSVQAGGTLTPRPQISRAGMNDGTVLEIDKAHMKHYAHFGYVYCMLLVRGVTRLVDSDEDVLISGGGDGTIKIWKLFEDHGQGIRELACLGEDDAESVLSMAIDGSFLYSSKLEGVIELWDLDTKQKLRVIRARKGDVMTLQMGWGYLWSGGSTGYARVTDLSHEQLCRMLISIFDRNTARSSMANTKTRRLSARSTTVSIDGKRMRDESSHRQSPPTMGSSCISREQMTTPYRFGI